MNGFGRLTTMLTKTSVVKILMEADPLPHASVVVSRAYEPTAAVRYVNDRCAA